MKALWSHLNYCKCECGMTTRSGSGYRQGHGPISGYRIRSIAPYNPVLVHRHRAEQALGKPLPEGAIVHHVDGSKSETAPLVICQDQGYHLLLHLRARVVAAGGNPNTQRFCRTCGELKLFHEMNKHNWNCYPCQRATAKRFWARKRQQQEQEGRV
jgi:hypothetical protein